MHHNNLTPPKGQVWFVGDTHFGHAGSISHTARPFASVDEMDRLLIEAWNAVVRPGDTVVHLGDFEWGHTPQRRDFRGAQGAEAFAGREPRP